MYWRLVLALLVSVVAVWWTLPTSARPVGDGKQLGFRLTLENGSARDVSSARLVALAVPAGARPSPFVPGGAFKATWEGEFHLDLPEDVTFSAEGRGKLLVKLKDQVLLDLSGEDFSKSPGKKVEVPGEPTSFTVTYEAPKEGDASVRVYWKGNQFVREPVHFSSMQHDTKSKEYQLSQQWRAGRSLVADWHCVKCHNLEESAMPELKSEAPSLANVGSRTNETWLAVWLQDPQKLRPQAHMPKVLASSEKSPGAEARDLAAYLVTFGAQPQMKEPLANEETINCGARLFAHLGCVSCHLLPTREEVVDEDHQRIPLRYVAAKWKPAALRAFLQNPAAHYPTIRMPNFGLSEGEVNQLAAFLLKTATGAVSDGPLQPGNANKGKELLAGKGCLACHAVAPEGKLTPPLAPAWAAIKNPEAGCLAAEVPAGGKVPAFGLRPEQRAALRTCLGSGVDRLKHDAPIDLAERTLVNQRCHSCHQRDGRDDTWTKLRDESDSLLNEYAGEDAEKDSIGQPFPAVQLRPPLTWTGEKLRPEWLRDFLTGKVKYKPRPYLRARMPHFNGPMEQLANGLVLQHGRAIRSQPFAPIDAQMAEVGRTLTAKKNWGCIACHNVGKSVAEAAFEAPGLNFSYSRERLTRDYFERWVYSPLRVEAGTKMPAVFQPGKKSLLDQFYDGDAEKQVEAMWQYLQMGDRIQYPPE